jgi:DNA-binding HxlR family transcriptional regulator
MTDTSIFLSLTVFKRDLLYTVRAIERDGDLPKGPAIKSYLETKYDDEIDDSPLNQNLNVLVDEGFLTKNHQDDQTNEYATTETTRELLEAQTRKRIKQVGLETDRSTQRRDETDLEPTASLLPDSENVTVLFDGEEMTVDEWSESSGTWTHEAAIGQVKVRFKWNDDFFTHTSALVGPDKELVALDFESSYSPGIDPVFVPTNDQYDFKVQLVRDEGSSCCG